LQIEEEDPTTITPAGPSAPAKGSAAASWLVKNRAATAVVADHEVTQRFFCFLITFLSLFSTASSSRTQKRHRATDNVQGPIHPGLAHAMAVEASLGFTSCRSLAESDLRLCTGSVDQ